MVRLTGQLEEFYEQGILNVLRAVPGNFPEQDRLSIESVVYFSYTLFRTYARLETTLAQATSDVGSFSGTPSILMDVFADAWSFIDKIYSLSKLTTCKPQRDYLSFSKDTKELLEKASDFRNFMDHIDKQFDNAVRAQGWFPLIGWLSYQFTPCARDASQPQNLIFLENLSSTHIRAGLTISAPDHTRAAVCSEIDLITLHLKNKKSCNLSDLMQLISIDLNNYSMEIQKSLYEFINVPDNQVHGLQVPFARATVRADLHEQRVALVDIKSVLDENKIRMEINISDDP